MKKLFYTSVQHDLTAAYEHERKIYVIQAESRDEAIQLLRPLLRDIYTDIEFNYAYGVIGYNTLIELNFFDSPVIHVEDIYTGD